MPQVSIDKLIGHNLKAKKTLNCYNLPDKPNKILFVIKPNGYTGIVYSYLTKTDGIWLQFKRSNGSFYYIKFTNDSFQLTGDVNVEVKKQQAQAEQEIIKEKGAVPYYIEKYGKWVLLYVVGAYLIGTYIKTKK
jgi:hypothetical protein